MNIGIVGGGISGLYSALLLRQQGHTVTVFEATDRLGGRIYTHRFQSQNKKKNGAYFEAGAMRIPRSPLHGLVFDLVRHINTHNPADRKVEFIPYILEHYNNDAYIQGKRSSIDSQNLSFSPEIPPVYAGKSARELLGEVVSPWLMLLKKDFDLGFQQLLRYDDISFRQYLRTVIGWPFEVIDCVELLMSQTNQYDLSFLEIIMQNLDFNTKEWVTIAGGMSRLVDGLANLIGSEHILRNAPIHRIEELPNNKVRLYADDTSKTTRDFDKVILCVPPAALQAIRERPQWSFMKEQAIRGSHYEPLYKLGLHFKTRFWEMSSRPSFGGQSTTDLRFRWIVYPSNDIGDQGSGVLLLYSWMTDATRISSLSKKDRLETALHDLNKFFAQDGVDVYTEFLDSFEIIWSGQSATGDAMFLPSQFTRFFEVAKRAEGNVFFAGEHLSRHHTWIAGALDSALTTVREILNDGDLRPLGREIVPGMEGLAKKNIPSTSRNLTARYLSDITDQLLTSLTYPQSEMLTIQCSPMGIT
ncbi:amine oxidase-11 [Coleophoma crateriformis]|uniref:Amine oxidase n=1 Tax=Coleophoma crateriformis TaxID=565419 RepID=A0A3D8SMT0_9HELO|nr:amine oxidase-11 [Coleophoma crateriformis]